MQTLASFINGQWVTPSTGTNTLLVNPADGTPSARIAFCTKAECDQAVTAAQHAFAQYAQTTVEERIVYLQRIRDGYAARMDEIALAMQTEMGAPTQFARGAQAESGLAHFDVHIQALREYAFEHTVGNSRVMHEAIGIAALITPWNWPMNQMVVKIIPALAAGCTMVLKPSELAPLSANILGELIEAAGVPNGVFNLVHGDGPGTGQALCNHPEVDMVSFTGSVRAGIAIGQSAAQTIKRVTLELGGKSPNLILRDSDFATAVRTGVTLCMSNSGQTCDAPSRMYVPRERYAEAMQLAADTANALQVGLPTAPSTDIGPVISQRQYENIQALIQVGLEEGATLCCGGPGKPEGLEAGFYVRPTVFGNVQQHMRIAREEVFGPVLALLAYDDEEQLVAMANDSNYGLAAYVSSTNIAHANRIARRLRAGQVQINYPEWDLYAPFGGYKRSGNGREYARWGLHDYLETKAIVGYSG